MSNNDGKIIDVYEENLNEEIKKISELIDDYNYVSMVIKIIKARILSSQVLFIL
jgi:hypothetical protein